MSFLWPLYVRKWSYWKIQRPRCHLSRPGTPWFKHMGRTFCYILCVPRVLTAGCWVTACAHSHSDRDTHIDTDTFIQLHAPHFGDFGMGDSAVQRGNLRGAVGEAGVHVAPAWRRHRSRCSLSCAGAICHLREHLQTQGALVTQC